jgi:hypothetical protein
LGRLDALRRFFLEGMDCPDIAAKLHRVDNDSAVRQMDWAPSGNFSNSFSAALIQETGRVLRTSAIRYRVPSICPKMLSYLTTARQSSLSLEEKFFAYENWNEAALHDNTRGGTFFTPLELAMRIEHGSDDQNAARATFLPDAWFKMKKC